MVLVGSNRHPSTNTIVIRVKDLSDNNLDSRALGAFEGALLKLTFKLGRVDDLDVLSVGEVNLEVDIVLVHLVVHSVEEVGKLHVLHLVQ